MDHGWMRIIISCPYWKWGMFLLRCYLTKEILLVKDKGSRVPHGFALVYNYRSSFYQPLMTSHATTWVYYDFFQVSYPFPKLHEATNMFRAHFLGGNSQIGRLYRYITSWWSWWTPASTLGGQMKEHQQFNSIWPGFNRLAMYNWTGRFLMVYRWDYGFGICLMV